MGELPLTLSTDYNFVSVEDTGIITGKEYFLFICGEGHSRNFCCAHELGTAVSSHGAPFACLHSTSAMSQVRSGISDGGDRGSCAVGRQNRQSQTVIRTGYASAYQLCHPRTFRDLSDYSSSSIGVSRRPCSGLSSKKRTSFDAPRITS